MAGDWIKMRADLQTHPKVVRILSALRLQCDGSTSDKFRVIGGLHAVWCVFDQHTEDGMLRGYTPETMDHVVGLNGISQAMIDVGWVEFEEPETLVMVDFEAHNGQSAKRRAEDQKRKRNVRRASAICPQDDGQEVEKKRTREEKRREEKNKSKDMPRKRATQIPDGFPGQPEMEWAKSNHPAVDADHEATQFREHAKANERKQKDWAASWRMWVGKAAKWNRNPTPQRRDIDDPLRGIE